MTIKTIILIYAVINLVYVVLSSLFHLFPFSLTIYLILALLAMIAIIWCVRKENR